MTKIINQCKNCLLYLQERFIPPERGMGKIEFPVRRLHRSLETRLEEKIL